MHSLPPVQEKLETIVMQNLGGGGRLAGCILVYVKILHWEACALSTQPRPRGFPALLLVVHIETNAQIT